MGVAGSHTFFIQMGVPFQGTAEGAPFDRKELEALMNLAGKGIGELTELQKAALSA